jgi:glycosyltransferase involved in cell wall biosynthesis
MYKEKKVAVVLPTYAERDSIRQVVNDFFNTGVVDDVIVVDNNAQAGTAENLRGSQARVIKEKRQGFGHAVKAGLSAADVDIVVVCEPDGTFLAKDIFRLLYYADHFDVILGTRTNKSYIQTGANMKFFLRHGNIITAKILGKLFNGPNLTDMGCTMRLIKKEALDRIFPQFSVFGPAFNAEMTILSLLGGLKVAEIPVSYGKRIGNSFGSGRGLNCFIIATQMFFVMFKYKIKSFIPSKKTGIGYSS